jgi:hypothetical protein
MPGTRLEKLSMVRALFFALPLLASCDALPRDVSEASAASEAAGEIEPGIAAPTVASASPRSRESADESTHRSNEARREREQDRRIEAVEEGPDR